MKKTLLSLAALIFLFSSINTSAESKIYHWIDADGKIHYADTATPGTEEIHLDNGNVVNINSNAPDTATEAAALEETASVAEALQESLVKYRATITSPADDSPLRSNDGTINIQVQTVPEKKATHKLQLVLDGRPLGSPQISSTIRASNIERGTHQIQVQLLDEQGNIVALTQVVTIHLQRASVR
ncbi:DUF4124 domain-containing protein [Psychromonas sp.]|uniref:DUF4124 domain-containing protein n=1 Tax=Psychromonas sp. TaxID=1884585 RepID=UPI003568544D